jgi:signal transduction histidine kinase/DNA-binding response OmpR family regulator
VEFNKQTETSILYQISSENLNAYRIIGRGIKDRTDRIWFPTNYKGVYEFLPEKKEFIKPVDVNLGILKIYEDKQGKFWLGTFANGLVLMDKEKGIIKSYTMKDGLPSNQVRDMIEDDEGNLWLLTPNGVSRFDPEKESFKNFGIEDGLKDKQYNSIHKSQNGEIFLGSSNGLVSFFPSQTKDNEIPPKVVITNISLFNRSDDSLKFDKAISDINEIELSYDKNDLYFEFVALHYVKPEQNLYSVMLENFDENWTKPVTIKSATYTNLDPGKYVFRVKAANSDGIWNELGASIKIIILPPWWATTWAYILYTILILSLIYFTWKLQLKRVRNKHELEMSRFETQKLHEVDEIKSRFFTNISHEFRTPLTLILGSVKQAINKIKDEKTKDDLSIAHKNASKLLGLVNQLLDISKLESGNMKLRTHPLNFTALLKALTLSFASYAERKRITLKFNSSEDEIIVYADKDKIEKIFTNILSNAFKFTPEGGKIEVSLSKKDKYLNAIISDTGIGIPKEKIAKIFDRFYQVDGSHTREREGTGIGLALTKELVELHKGKIEVESEESKGTMITVSIPLGKEHLQQEEISEEKESEYYEHREDIGIPDLEQEKERKPKLDVEFLADESLPLLLIVEDNAEVRKYIKDNLMSEFRTIEAVDGEDGWNKSIEQMPDLIISDVMMPKMDGFKLCKKLKTDERTSHIPIILLTAKAAREDKLEGYELGADEYLMKPFEPEELKARIKNLLDQRKRLQEHFKNEGIVELNHNKISSIDKKFLRKALDLVHQNISDATFNVEAFGEKIGMSRSVLHKKLVSLAGEPPVEFIRRIRLNYAQELIVKKFGNLSEIALEAGFNNPAYFSECFKKQFGITPSHYQQKITNS